MMSTIWYIYQNGRDSTIGRAFALHKTNQVLFLTSNMVHKHHQEPEVSLEHYQVWVKIKNQTKKHIYTFMRILLYLFYYFVSIQSEKEKCAVFHPRVVPFFCTDIHDLSCYSWKISLYYSITTTDKMINYLLFDKEILATVLHFIFLKFYISYFHSFILLYFN